MSTCCDIFPKFKLLCWQSDRRSFSWQNHRTRNSEDLPMPSQDCLSFQKTSNDFWRLPKVAKDFPTTSSCKEKHLLHFGFKLKIKIEFFGSQLFSWLSIFSAKRFKYPFLGVKLPEMTLVIFWEILPSLFSFMSQLKSNCLHLPWHEINEFGEMCPTKVKLCKIFLV